MRDAVGSRKTVWLIIPVLLSSTGGLLRSPARAADVVYVDDGGDCEGNSPCFTTVQAGVNNASAPGDEAEVRIFPGTYNESVDVGTMGSAVGGTPGDIRLINQSFLTTFGFPPATAPAALPGSVSEDLIEQWDAARNRMAEWAAIGLPPPTAPDAAVIPVLIHSPGGPAIRTSMPPYPSSVFIIGIDVLSPNDHGVSLTSLGELEYNFGNASGNGGDGIRLTATGLVSVGLSTLNDNKGSGAVLESIAEDIFVINTCADRNMGFGFAMAAFDVVTVFRTPVANTPFGGLLDQITARQNKLGGMTAQSSQETVTVADIAFLGGITFPTSILLNDNEGDDGLSITADEGATVAGVQANGNAGNGVIVNTPGTLTVIGTTANDNDLNGIHVPGAGLLFFIAVVASDNDMNGILAQANDISSEPLQPIGLFSAILAATTTERNDVHGTEVLSTTGPIFILGPVSIGNALVGVRLTPAAGSQNRVEGGIICSNASGLALLSNSLVDAEGNWWGSASGPFHPTKNPGGTGNTVLDAMNLGLGDVDFDPWIDTVTGSAANPPMAGVPSPVAFEFSGGNGTVFLGAQIVSPLFVAFGPGAVPPFTVTTDNGVIGTAIETGPSARTFLTGPNGIAEVDLIAFRTGPATVTITGPCGLAGTLTVNVVAAEQAPLLSVMGLLAALVALCSVGAIALRRSRSIRPFS